MFHQKMLSDSNPQYKALLLLGYLLRNNLEKNLLLSQMKVVKRQTSITRVFSVRGDLVVLEK